MRFTLQSRHLDLTRTSDERIRRRLSFALGRFADQLASVTLRLVDSNGPKGGPAIDGLVEIRLVSGEHLVISDRDLHPEPLALRILERARLAVARLIDRNRVDTYRRSAAARLAGN